MNVDKQTDLSYLKLEAAGRHVSLIQKLAKEWKFQGGRSPFKEKTRQFCTKMKFLPFFKNSGWAGGGQNYSVGFLDLSSSLAKGTSVMSLIFQSPRNENYDDYEDSWPLLRWNLPLFKGQGYINRVIPISGWFVLKSIW